MRNYTISRGVQGLAALAVAFAAGCATTNGQYSAANTPSSGTRSGSAYPAASRTADTAQPGFSIEAGMSAATPSAVIPAVREDAPLHYVVKKGDTLWDIAGRFLIEPWQWPEVWVVNRQVRNPHLIYPGDELTLITRDGRPRVELTGSGRLSPRIRESDLGAAIPTIPIDAIRDFLLGPRLVTADEIARAPYVVDFVDPHILGAAGHGAYVKKLSGGHSLWEMVRIGERYVDPDSKEVLGYEAIPVAQAEVLELAEPGMVQLTRSYRETRIGDYLVRPPAEGFNSDFYPRPPPRAVRGRILSVFDGVSQIGQYQIVALSRGARDGLEPGHLLDILQTGRKARDPHGPGSIKLPETFAGQLMVFKVEDKVSFALVMEAVREVHVLDVVANPGTRTALR
jgi:LysM repeat protein